jgi:hypothetical protein
MVAALPEHVLGKVIEQIPAGRLGEPDRIGDRAHHANPLELDEVPVGVADVGVREATGMGATLDQPASGVRDDSDRLVEIIGVDKAQSEVINTVFYAARRALVDSELMQNEDVAGVRNVEENHAAADAEGLDQSERGGVERQ